LITPALIELQKKELGFREEEINDKELLEFFGGKKEL